MINEWNENPLLPILFHLEEITFDFEQPDKIATWINQTIIAEKCELEQVNFIFCNDTYLHQINVDYLQHDTLTDVITFPYSQAPNIEGDIFISLERIEENAKAFEVTFQKELLRVMIHGILHLCGYEDKTTTDKQLMTAKENEALSKFFK